MLSVVKSHLLFEYHLSFSVIASNYHPQRSWGKVIFSEACVKNSVHRGAGVWADTPPQGAVHAGRYGQQAGGTYPTGMHTCFLSVFYSV